MKAKMKIIIFFMSSFLLPVSFCKASFFVMNLKQDSIYTPGNINLTMKLTEEAKIENNYQFKVSIFLTGTLIREQTIKADREKPVNFELTVPEVFDRTEGRCRCELLIAENFLEAQEVPLLLWPSIGPYKQERIKNTEIWVYDTSGKLLELFGKMDIKVVDATFKTARDFGKPDIVFVGENTDPNNMQILADGITSAKTEPVLIYLRQKQFLKESKIEVPTDNNLSKTIGLIKTNVFMAGLDFRDVTTLANNSHYLKIKKDDADKIIRSYVDEVIKDEKNLYSYLCTIRQKNQVVIYCQLPVTDGNDPRSAVLLKNILNYTESVINEIKAK
ncbi:MAG: hypothetical protein JW787_14535 [Sedimentisphaerales bacterium]|nr:hypothetical protein [Sedimentisphaerales bacterium]